MMRDEAVFETNTASPEEFFTAKILDLQQKKTFGNIPEKNSPLIFKTAAGLLFGEQPAKTAIFARAELI
jgi:hypothetical protein